METDPPLVLPSPQEAPACALVIFGGSGDLTHRKLMPALYNLMLDGLLPAGCTVLGLGRKPMDDAAFRAVSREGVARYSRRPLDVARWAEFSQRLFYCAGDIAEADLYRKVKTHLAQCSSDAARPSIFYLAIPPASIPAVCHGLRQSGLATPQQGPACRIIVEKPIGHDWVSARHINAVLGEVFEEPQVFRIDHYLGKETVQNLLVFRFANGLFEPLWNNRHIDHVQITVAEEEGVGARGETYEAAGALRDVVQNHLLQLLCLVAMDPPRSLSADAVRDAKLEVLRSLRRIRGDRVESDVIRAQYGPGWIRGKAVPGYRREAGIRPDSTTETFTALKLFIDNWRWVGVPFYLRTGKRMSQRVSEIVVEFKAVPPVLFNANRSSPLPPNALAFRIQPKEGTRLEMMSKVPGAKFSLQQVMMDFDYQNAYTAASPEAYERLLLDVMVGDQTLFMRYDEVEAAWEWMGPILEQWGASSTTWLPEYGAGSLGPVEADRLIERDGRKWRTL